MSASGGDRERATIPPSEGIRVLRGHGRGVNLGSGAENRSPHPHLPTIAAMPKTSKVSAGLLLYRRGEGGLEVFLAHPGGPFWKGRDEAAWTIPKGMVEPGESPLEAAVREFREETGLEPEEPLLPLGSIRQKAGKVVHAWAWEGDADPSCITSNLTRSEWPRGSGRWQTYPEVDRCSWFAPPIAKRKINAAQAELIERLEAHLAEQDDD